MSAIISPTEPKPLRDIGITDLVAETYGADILVPAKGYFIGVQRKVFPADFLASLYDGRLSTSLVKLTKCEVRILILEGTPRWTTSGFLDVPRTNSVTFARSQLRSLLLSAHYELGVHSMWTDNLSDTIDVIRDLVRWGNKDKHESLFTRPNPATDPYKRRTFSERDRGVFLLQGFDGIGPTMAQQIYDHFRRVPLRWDDDGELINVPGIGPGRIAKLKELFK